MKRKNIPDKFLETLTRYCGYKKGQRVLLGVSGGVDSMVMCHLFLASDIRIGIAHVNFSLRGEDSDTDEAFVRSFAEKYKLSFHTERFDTRKIASEHKEGIQETARKLRYGFFEKIRVSEKFDAIAIAHHCDDQAETILHHLIRGTGIEGLKGMQYKNGFIIRPLLPFTKQDLLKLAQNHAIAYRTDASNENDYYTRNFIRLSIVPLLEQINPNVKEAIVHAGKRIEGLISLSDTVLKNGLKKYIQKARGYEWIDIGRLHKRNGWEILTYQHLSSLGFYPNQIEQLIEATYSAEGQMFESKKTTLHVERGKIFITIVSDSVNEGIIKVERPKKLIKLGKHKEVKMDTREGIAMTSGQQTVLFDPNTFTFPIEFRRWQAGDYFYPEGLYKKNSSKPGKKKVSDALNSLKLSTPEKNDTWVMISNGKIAWIVGYRVDYRFLKGKLK